MGLRHFEKKKAAKGAKVKKSAAKKAAPKKEKAAPKKEASKGLFGSKK
jgi:hypothetical protein